MTSVNLTAPFNRTGYGHVSKNILRFLSERCEVGYWPIGPFDYTSDEELQVLRKGMAGQATYNPDAPSLRIYHQFDLAQHIGRGKRVAMPIFELDKFRPVEKHHLSSQDLLLVNSQWAKSIIEKNGIQCPTRVVPLGVDQRIFHPVDDSASGDVAVTTFVNIGKWELRKGHDFLLQAFTKAFEPTDRVRLVMLCHNPCFRTEQEMKKYNGEWESYYEKSKLASKIYVHRRSLPTQNDVAMLMGSADCGVFPSRAEGWNMEAAEMLAMGKEVILTDYSGHTEYADAGVARMITVGEMEEAHDGIWFRADLAEWAGEPGCWARLGDDQMEQLVNHLREVHRLKQEGALSANAAGAERMKRYNWGETARLVLKEIGDV